MAQFRGESVKRRRTRRHTRLPVMRRPRRMDDLSNVAALNCNNCKSATRNTQRMGEDLRHAERVGRMTL